MEFRIFLVAFLLTIGITLPNPHRLSADAPGSVIGTWAVAGSNPDGTGYVYEVAVEDSELGFAIVTYYDKGQPVAGCGMLRDGNVAVLDCNPTSMSVVRIESADKMTMIWVTPDSNGTGRETWTSIPKLTVPPAAHEHDHGHGVPGQRL